MTQWRIRLAIPEAGTGRDVVTSALGQLPVAGLQVLADGGLSESAADMVVELADDSALDDLLRALHEISPQVSISRVGGRGTGGSEQRIKVRRLAPGTVPG